MPDSGNALTARVVDGIDEIAAAAWDACAGEANPFVSHAFLAALEGSRSVAAETGWVPRHLALYGTDGRLDGCMPLYLKSHSYGEYVFDWSWARAYEQAGGRYYPKLQAAVPFTPVPGPRLLVRPDAPAATGRLLADTLRRVAASIGVSSAHVTFLPEADVPLFRDQGFLARLGHQYHWHNAGYGGFDDFLASLASRKRKQVRKERAAAAATGLTLRWRRGSEIGLRHWDAFYRFYLDTVDRKWAHAYLNREFFSRLATGLGDAALLAVAETETGEPVAAALHVQGADTLYGRYWGCAAEFKFLHFELCYYMAIELAIEHGLARVEAGAQGEHKVQRGYLPTPTWSVHWIADPAFRLAVQRFLAEEQRQVAAEMQAIEEAAPFRQADSGGP